MKPRTRSATVYPAVLCSIFFFAGTALSETRAYREVESFELPTLRARTPVGVRLSALDDGRMYLSGSFVEVNGEGIAGIARLFADGSVDHSFQLSASLPVDPPPTFPWLGTPGGRIYFAPADEFTSFPVLRRLSADGGLDESYHLEAKSGSGAGAIERLVAGLDGRILVIGGFDSLGGFECPGVAQLRADGSVDDGFVFEPTDGLVDAVPLTGGEWMVMLQTEPDFPLGRSIVRITSDGSVDTEIAAYTWRESHIYKLPERFAADAGGRIVLTELHEGAEGVRAYLKLIRLKGNGERETMFDLTLPTLLGDETQFLPTPRLRQIVSDGEGGVYCVGAFEDEALQGMVHVSEEGGIIATGLHAPAGSVVRWLMPDGAGGWWAETVEHNASTSSLRMIRLTESGEVDPDFSVSTLGAGAAAVAAVTDDGEVLVLGAFSMIGGQPAEGIAFLDAAGGVRTIDLSPWKVRWLVSALDDGSFLFEPGEQTPLLRVQPDGRAQPLNAGALDIAFATDAWLDAQGRLLALAGLDRASDPWTSLVLLRFTPDGLLDESYRATDVQGNVLSPQAAAATDDGTGAWAVTYSEAEWRLYRLDETGRELFSASLTPARAGGGGGSVGTIRGFQGGVLIEGDFETLNGVFAPLLALVRADGTVDAGWGGWLKPDGYPGRFHVLDDDRIHLTGWYTWNGGIVNSWLLTPTGLPDLNFPAEVREVDAALMSRVVSPDGNWIVEQQADPTSRSIGVRMWRSEEVPETTIAVPPGPVRVGETVDLELSTAGSAASIAWLRDGLVIAGATAATQPVLVRATDDGVVYTARLTLGDGTIVYSQPWRLELAPPAARIVNGSVRAWCGRDEETLVLGAAVGGSGREAVLARALGPALEDFGVVQATGPVGLRLLQADSRGLTGPAAFEAARDGSPVAHAVVSEAARSVGAYLPELSRMSGNDQMLYPAFGAGTMYVQCVPRDQGLGGVALAELFVVGPGSGERRGNWFRNFSGRARIGAGGLAMIGGFVVEGDHTLRVLVRGVGPGLGDFGTTSALSDPRLAIFGANGSLAVNDDWSTDPEGRDAVQIASIETGAFPLVEGSKDAAMVVELVPGVYTVVLSGAGSDADGLALLEIYAIE